MKKLKWLFLTMSIMLLATVTSCSFFPDEHVYNTIQASDSTITLIADRYNITLPIEKFVCGYSYSGVTDGYRLQVFQLDGDEEFLSQLHEQRDADFESVFKDFFVTTWVEGLKVEKDTLLDFDKDYTWYCAIYNQDYYQAGEVTDRFLAFNEEPIDKLALCYQKDTKILYCYDMWL